VSSEFKRTFDERSSPPLERITTSLWERPADAEAYRLNVYPRVLKILSRTIDGVPKIHPLMR
jgi:hypothetical protein